MTTQCGGALLCNINSSPIFLPNSVSDLSLWKGNSSSSHGICNVEENYCLKPSIYERPSYLYKCLFKIKCNLNERKKEKKVPK